MNERAQIVRENENINTVEKFTLTSIIVAQKNGLCLRRFLSGHYTTGAWSIRRYCSRNYWERGEFSRRLKYCRSLSIKFIKRNSAVTWQSFSVRISLRGNKSRERH